MPKTSQLKQSNPKSRNSLSKWLPRLKSTETQTVIELPARLINADNLADRLRQVGFYVLQIGGPDESPIANKEALLRALVRTQSLPKTFGFNWDALVDSLSNLEQPNATGYALILRQPRPLQTQSPEDYETLIEVLEEVSARWARSGVPFKLLVPRQS